MFFSIPLADDVIVSVGGIKVVTEHELKEAYAQARDYHDCISFIVKREVLLILYILTSTSSSSSRERYY